MSILEPVSLLPQGLRRCRHAGGLARIPDHPLGSALQAPVPRLPHLQSGWRHGPLGDAAAGNEPLHGEGWHVTAVTCVSWVAGSKVPRRGGLRRRRLSSHSLEAESEKVSRALLPVEAPGEGPSCFFQQLGPRGFPGCFPVVCASEPTGCSSLCLRTPFPSLLLMKMSVVRLRACLADPGWPLL